MDAPRRAFAPSAPLDPDWIELMYEQWRADPGSLSDSWQAFFRGFELASCDRACASGERADSQSRLIKLIDAYRRRGHEVAWLDPLQERPALSDRLRPEAFGFTDRDLDRVFDTGDLSLPQQASLREVLAALQRTWCGSIGVEYMHIQDARQRSWLQTRMERSRGRPELPREQKRDILGRLIDADIFETFLHTRYRGQKRFSLEGAEAIIPALHAVVELAPELGIEELVVGMAHRGRLNVLANILDKSYAEIFAEFEGSFLPGQVYGDGDVRYHKGFSSAYFNRAGRVVHVGLAANPSHLEAVDPVVQGLVRAKQRQRGDADERRKVVPLLVHGDAAFAGQGIVAETFNLSQLQGYKTGGTVHLVINNGIGFTALPEESRSTRYCTDVAKMIEAPIFHVNGDDPEAVVLVSELALRYRQEFGRDVVVDVFCYRRHGHNESDEPAYTQPLLYARIREQLPVRQRYTAQLVAEGLLLPEDEERIAQRLSERLARIHDEVRRAAHHEELPAFGGRWEGMEPPWPDEPTATGVDAAVLAEVGRALCTLPEGFEVSRKFARQLARRSRALDGAGPIDWALAESLAWGALLVEGFQVRLSGQDSVRGTFSQRHAEWTDPGTGAHYRPLNHIRAEQAHFCAYNSSLSEAAVLGFDFGYSLAEPQMLIQWEAQFGDFANGAQVISDQFVVASYSKWARSSGLVLLLPHGYEGQGPEHSNAYMERWLAACAEINIQVVQPSTPAQYFHLLRRQMLRPFRLPLVVFTPKGLLRHPACVSALSALERDQFEEVLDDPTPPASPQRVVLCSGRIFYDLQARREAEGLQERVALVRVEQLYPYPRRQLQALLSRYGSARWVWAQDEPRNRGGWSFMRLGLLADHPGRPVAYAGRAPSASAATGVRRQHDREQEAVLRAALGLVAAGLEE